MLSARLTAVCLQGSGHSYQIVKVLSIKPYETSLASDKLENVKLDGLAYFTIVETHRASKPQDVTRVVRLGAVTIFSSSCIHTNKDAGSVPIMPV